MSENLIEISNLTKHFPIYGGVFLRQIKTVFALNGINLQVKKGETVGIVGESGCGKSTLGKTMLRLYDPTAGNIEFAGKDITHISQKELRSIRRNMQIIFQDPFESLNSRHTIGEILEEPFIIQNIGSSKERKKSVCTLLEKVELPASSVNKYTHEFSGGQRQRIGIARAIALEPKLIVCDEPVSALDVSIQSQILNLLLQLQKDMGLTFVFIAHDLAVVKHISDHIAVMYLGKIVEYADSETIYRDARHPYTKALISAIPLPDPKIKREKIILKGDVPSPINLPNGCSFHTRCPVAIDICQSQVPALKSFDRAGLHQVACHLVKPEQN
jgi:peptide/nickel transport system ATP-binding protein